MGELGKMYKASATCIFNYCWALRVLLLVLIFFLWQESYMSKYLSTFHCVEIDCFKTCTVVSCHFFKTGRCNLPTNELMTAQCAQARLETGREPGRSVSEHGRRNCLWECENKELASHPEGERSLQLQKSARCQAKLSSGEKSQHHQSATPTPSISQDRRAVLVILEENTLYVFLLVDKGYFQWGYGATGQASAAHA